MGAVGSKVQKASGLGTTVSGPKKEGYAGGGGPPDSVVMSKMGKLAGGKGYSGPNVAKK